MNKTELGQKGEIEARKYLEKLGYFVMATNFKCSFGEIDIIAINGEELVFVEVKTRCSKKYGEPRDAVDKHKRKHIKKAATFYLYKNRFENEFVRFDVIEVFSKDDKFSVRHIKNTLW